MPTGREVIKTNAMCRSGGGRIGFEFFLIKINKLNENSWTTDLAGR
jgi:hypothetical protein